MRGRILWTAMAAVIGAAALTGCDKPDSLYIEPGKPQETAKKKPEPKAPEKVPAKAPEKGSPARP